MTKIITYSPAYTLVPTYECFNRCSYCNFRTEPNQDTWLSLTEAEARLGKFNPKKITEILILSGEVHPKSSRRQAWFQRIYDLAKLALAAGFFPHTNAGILSYEEMAQLKQVNVSMGLMLEQLTPKLLNTVHRYAPSKISEIRLQQLEWAGKLKIPFTTGLLLGIGESLEDCWETLNAIADIQQQWGHIQEVILQPYSVGNKQNLDAPSFDIHQLPVIIAKARDILPESITIQIPPNLISDTECLLACIDAGARDLGGIVPIDEVNPDYHHRDLNSLTRLLNSVGWELKPRLPVYPQYYDWLPENLIKLTMTSSTD